MALFGVIWRYLALFGVIWRYFSLVLFQQKLVSISTLQKIDEAMNSALYDFENRVHHDNNTLSVKMGDLTTQSVVFID